LRVYFSDRGWAHYSYWVERGDMDMLTRINALIENIRRTPFQGIGKPELLKGDLAGFWSRRITGEHRLVYAVEGKSDGQHVFIVQCRYHY
jgi:toxin YoeB